MYTVVNTSIKTASKLSNQTSLVVKFCAKFRLVLWKRDWLKMIMFWFFLNLIKWYTGLQTKWEGNLIKQTTKLNIEDIELYENRWQFLYSGHQNDSFSLWGFSILSLSLCWAWVCALGVNKIIYCKELLDYLCSLHSSKLWQGMRSYSDKENKHGCTNGHLIIHWIWVLSHTKK